MASLEQQDEFVAFRESCMWLQNCFNTFQHLYNSDPETEAALRRTASLFFGDLNSILQEYFFLQARKITDPARSYGRENLSVNDINAGLTEAGLMTPEISALSASMLSYRTLISDISNRVVAHADKATALCPGLVGAHSESELESFMSNIRAYTDAVGIALGIGPLDYKTQAGSGDVVDLIRTLKQA
ncbi:AbiU2 domain-containing protein [Luteimonas sp. A277]